MLLIIGTGAAGYWAYREQSVVLIGSANQFLAPYGIEVLEIHGLQTGLQQSRADSVEFRIEGQPAVQRIHAVTLSYELSTLIRGQFSQLSAQSANLQLQQSALPDGATVEITAVKVSCQAFTLCSGSAAIGASIPSVASTLPAVDAGDITTGGRINFDYNAPVLQVNLEPGLEFTVAGARIHDDSSALLDVEQLSLTSSQTWRLNFDMEEQLLVFDGGQLHIKAPALRNQPDTEDAGLSGFEAEISRFNGSYNLIATDSTTSWKSRLSTQIALEVSNVYTTLQPFNLWSYRWPVNLQWHPAQGFRIGLDAVAGDTTILTLQLNQNPDDGSGTLSLETRALVFSSAEDSLSALISPLPLDADLVHGELDIGADIHWTLPVADGAANPDISTWQPGGTIRLEATGLAGVIDETIFTGLTTSAEWQLQSDLSLISSAVTPLQIQEINPGLPLSNIQTLFYADTGSGVLELSSLNLEMFGGEVTADPFAINLKQTDTETEFGDTFELRMEGVDISEVLSLSAYTGVSATGVLNGTLPIRLQGLRPVITDGHLTTVAPGGSIRYNSGDAATGNQSLDLVYQALEHYRYETLTANVDYNEAGELTLEMQMQGESPELNNGQRINLNLNISDNIPALLQSLQAAQGITDRLEEMLE